MHRYFNKMKLTIYAFWDPLWLTVDWLLTHIAELVYPSLKV